MDILMMSLQAGVYIALLLALHKVLKRKVPARVLPWLWMPAVLRLLVPGGLKILPQQVGISQEIPLWRNIFEFAPQLDAVMPGMIELESAAGLAGASAAGATEAAAAGAVASNAAASGAVATGAATDLPVAESIMSALSSGLLVLWLAGVVIVALYFLMGALRLHRRVRGAQPHATEKGVWVCEGLEGPVSTLLRIYVPADLAEANLAHVLLHERSHLQAGHPWAKLLACAAVCVHWFNPLVWKLASSLSRDLEMACDAKVVQRLDAVERMAYAHALVSLAAQGCAAPVASAFAQHPVAERVGALLRPARGWRPAVAALLCAVVCGTGMFAQTAELAMADDGTIEGLSLPIFTYFIRIEQEDGPLIERLEGISLKDKDALDVLAYRGHDQVFIPQEDALPEGIYRKARDTLALRYYDFGREETEDAIIDLPEDFERPDRIYYKRTKISETATEYRWRIRASYFADVFNYTSIEYGNKDGSRYLWYRIFLGVPENIGDALDGRIGLMDNGLMVISELYGPDGLTITAMSETDYYAWLADKTYEPLVYQVHSMEYDAWELLEFLETAQAA